MVDAMIIGVGVVVLLIIIGLAIFLTSGGSSPSPAPAPAPAPADGPSGGGSPTTVVEEPVSMFENTSMLEGPAVVEGPAAGDGVDSGAAGTRITGIYGIYGSEECGAGYTKIVSEVRGWGTNEDGSPKNPEKNLKLCAKIETGSGPGIKRIGPSRGSSCHFKTGTDDAGDDIIEEWDSVNIGKDMVGMVVEEDDMINLNKFKNDDTNRLCYYTGGSESLVRRNIVLQSSQNMDKSLARKCPDGQVNISYKRNGYGRPDTKGDMMSQSGGHEIFVCGDKREGEGDM